MNVAHSNFSHNDRAGYALEIAFRRQFFPIGAE
jgi:hypothetical protein